jgi:branched-chain amino acid aminotransferase
MSPCLIRELTPDGLCQVSYTADSLADAVHYEPRDGVYTVTNTYNTFQVLKLDAHLDRLEDSAQRVNIPLKLDRKRLRSALYAMITEANFGSVRFRITISHDQPDHFILSVEPFHPPSAEVYTNGVRCITIAHVFRQNPAAKTTGWMHEREGVKLPDGIYTGLLLDSDGNILEGTTSNFYAILDNELRTAGGGVLSGIAQQIVFAIAPAIMPLRQDAVNIQDIPRLAEAFITSSSRGIVPVVEIDGVRIGDGKPGPQTIALSQAYQIWVQSHLEDLISAAEKGS